MKIEVGKVYRGSYSWVGVTAIEVVYGGATVHYRRLWWPWLPRWMWWPWLPRWMWWAWTWSRPAHDFAEDIRCARIDAERERQRKAATSYVSEIEYEDTKK
jgi:hypothetical protein